MKPYLVRFTVEGLEDVKGLPRNARNRLKKEIPERIGQDPNGCSDPLRPPLEKYRSCHIGEYRVVFYVADDIRSVAIAGIGKHSKQASKDIYKRLETVVSQGKLAEKILAALRGFTAS